MPTPPLNFDYTKVKNIYLTGRCLRVEGEDEWMQFEITRAEVEKMTHLYAAYCDEKERRIAAPEAYADYSAESNYRNLIATLIQKHNGDIPEWLRCKVVEQMTKRRLDFMLIHAIYTDMQNDKVRIESNDQFLEISTDNYRVLNLNRLVNAPASKELLAEAIEKLIIETQGEIPDWLSSK